MPTTTYQVQLESVQAAIAQIEQTGQSYSIDNRSLSRADLDKLYARETYLRGKAAREARGGGVRVRYGASQ